MVAVVLGAVLMLLLEVDDGTPRTVAEVWVVVVGDGLDVGATVVVVSAAVGMSRGVSRVQL